MKAFCSVLNRWGPVAVWIWLVVVASTGVGSADVSAKVFKPFFLWFWPGLSAVDARELNMIFRKTAHVVQFFVYGLLVWRAVRVPPAWPVGFRTLALWIVGSALALGLLSEGIQLFYIERGASWLDVGLDMSGAVLAVAVIRFLERRRQVPADAG